MKMIIKLLIECLLIRLLQIRVMFIRSLSVLFLSLAVSQYVRGQNETKDSLWLNFNNAYSSLVNQDLITAESQLSEIIKQDTGFYDVHFLRAIVNLLTYTYIGSSSAPMSDSNKSIYFVNGLKDFEMSIIIENRCPNCYLDSVFARTIFLFQPDTANAVTEFDVLYLGPDLSMIVQGVICHFSDSIRKHKDCCCQWNALKSKYPHLECLINTFCMDR